MELVKSVPIDKLLAHRKAVIDRLKQAQILLNEAADIADQAHITDSKTYRTLGHAVNGTNYNKWDDIIGEGKDKRMAAAIAQLDAWAWDYLMDESGMKTFMHSKAREEWSKQISERKTPELTLENIQATFKELWINRAKMRDDGVLAVFKSLSWDYKTNSPIRFGKKLILSYIACPDGSPRYGHNCGTDKVDDLIRVCCLLDDKPEPDHRQGTYAKMSQHKKDRCLENDYFKMVWYKNGNGHITFKRDDIIIKLNEILARYYPNALPYDPKR